MQDILNCCNQKLIALPCCHGKDDSDCNCYGCLHNGFYEESDTYGCLKKLCFYVMNYGPSYASEIYHYLSLSRLLEDNFQGRTVKILSLGCGYAPDLISLNKYIEDEKLPITIEYKGMDQSPLWRDIRRTYKNATFCECDLLSGFDLSDCDIIFIIKLFSTLYKNKLGDKFLSILREQVAENLKSGAFLVLNDINSRYMGRDIFHQQVKGLFRCYRQYYCGDPPYTEPFWERIPQRNIVFSISSGLKFAPLNEIRNMIFFEYKK